MKIITSNFTSREELVKLLKPNSILAELGVASGKLSAKLLKFDNVQKLYSIDAWAGDRGHDETQFTIAKNTLEIFGERSEIVRKYFSEAVKDFADNFFDLIYIDGYAHTGQEQGKTLFEWYSKVKIGGIISGDDYSENWPLNKNFIDKFANHYNLELNVINDWNSHRTWFAYKK